ncbi:MAG: GspH/FimT family pseudopilin [Gammaproteobacteria bacterium]|nr:GspH/FimT family pseudopilin [Gammaproteobacteria bacterium]
MLKRAPARGFTLIELMVTMAVMVVLALLAVPSLSMYVENAKVRGTAEVLYASVQQARTEAIRRNATVELIFTDQAPTAGNVDTSGLTTAGPNWIIRQVPPTPSADPIFIEGRTGAEGCGREGGISSALIAASTNTVAFNPLGALGGTTPVSIDLSSHTAGCTPGGAIRCLRVTVSTGGQARMCDPAANAAGDTRRCSP